MKKTSHILRVKRALVSVSDKRDLIPFVAELKKLKVEVISTGGTAKLLRQEGIAVREISKVTGFPEILGGRVKTLHPKVQGGILADRRSAKQMSQARKLKLPLIDLVVVNLYPFEAAEAKEAALSKLIEEIDIGGVTLLRAAAKNFHSVAVVSRPEQYPEVLSELIRSGARLSEATRKRLAVAAFSQTAYYDTLIHQTLAHRGIGRKRSLSEASALWPDHLVLGLTRRQILRYGENPHQAAAWYQWPALCGGVGAGLAGGRQLHGKELSFNNLLDLEAAMQVTTYFRSPTAVVIKHNNPCGVASSGCLRSAFEQAFACDPVSAFGGIVGLNRKVDVSTARAIAASGFLECLVAPGYQAAALKLLQKKKNLRILEVPSMSQGKLFRCLDLKQAAGGLLVQSPDTAEKSPSRWRRTTSLKPTAAQMIDLAFAWRLTRFVRSNAIVIVKGERTVGIGMGQPSRVDSVRLALRQAGPKAKGAILASDGFFPKPDGPRMAIRAGIRAIVQPGGSVRDAEVIRAAQQGRIPMLLTGERHFTH